MSIDRRFSSTVPASLDALPEPVSAPAPIDAMRSQDLEVAGAVANEFGVALARVRAAVGQLASTSGLAKSHMQPVELALDQAQRAMSHGRLLARVASGEVRQTPSQTPLEPVLRAALEARDRRSDAAGRFVRRNVDPVTVVVDPDVVAALIDALLDWSQESGHQTEVTLQVKEWPAHGLLTLRCRPAGVEAPQGTSDQERLSWYLARELCRLCGATLDRVMSPGLVMVLVEFPRTVRELDGVSAMEVDFGGHVHPADATRVLAGHRVLIISSDVKLREEAKRICQDMGLTVENLPSSSLALQHCEQATPDLVIVDERFNDERFAQLRTLLGARRDNFPLIEIAYAADQEMSIAGWGAEGLTRVGRGLLASQLPQALTLEMAKVL